MRIAEHKFPYSVPEEPMLPRAAMAGLIIFFMTRLRADMISLLINEKATASRTHRRNYVEDARRAGRSAEQPLGNRRVRNSGTRRDFAWCSRPGRCFW